MIRIALLMVPLFLIFVNTSLAQSAVSKVEVGAQFTSIIASDPPVFPRTLSTRWVPGFGGRLTFNLTNHVAIEAEGNLFPRADDSDRIGEGRKTQALFGVKAGIRRDKYGLFAKARPGFMYFSMPTLECPLEEGICQPGQKIRFAADFGGVVELYPSPRVLVRFDAGDTVIRFPDVRRSISEPGFPTKRGAFPGGTTHNFQFSVGVGFRL